MLLSPHAARRAVLPALIAAQAPREPPAGRLSATALKWIASLGIWILVSKSPLRDVEPRLCWGLPPAPPGPAEDDLGGLASNLPQTLSNPLMALRISGLLSESIVSMITSRFMSTKFLRSK